ncbi:hypothetical protein IMX26_07435 [Clostridium sp. 'deep sea']|uniref:stalk domain-containing protein n=1 Tax=Clostridium sp. 'deep sea' TaxID=2779445 RepID=UPI00189684F2|nr:stalk domain-containing protein [Clostridium sp. 'deep sea']QOR36630.1 hypothetical protein IMX26_07435 [Clostridium sp. 'deep sea']
MSKKFILVYLPFLLMLILVIMAYKPIFISLNNVPIEFTINPILVNDTIIVSLPEIANILNAKTLINNSKQSILIFNNYNYIMFYPQAKKYIVDGLEYNLKIDLPIIKNTYMVPLNPVLKCFGATIERENYRKKLVINISY